MTSPLMQSPDEDQKVVGRRSSCSLRPRARDIDRRSIPKTPKGLSGSRTTPRLVAALIALLLLVGCGGDKTSLDPPDIAYGEDISEMGMFVVDPRFTVAALSQDDEWILFDDIGELLKYHDRFPDTDFQVTWVPDYHSESWIEAEDAWFLQSPGFNTPMGWMVGTFEHEDEARTFMEEHGGDLMTWQEANDLEWTDPPAPADHSGHN